MILRASVLKSRATARNLTDSFKSVKLPENSLSGSCVRVISPLERFSPSYSIIIRFVPTRRSFTPPNSSPSLIVPVCPSGARKKTSLSALRWKAARGFSLMELMVVVGLTGVIAAIAVPMMSNTLGTFRLSGDARGLSNAASLAKLRAASDFSQSRLFVDLSTNSFYVQTWQKTGVPGWVTEGGIKTLSTNVRFSSGVVTTPPANTQGDPIRQAPACVTTAGVAIGNTACALFNSRGIPVDAAGAPPAVGAPTAADALYLTDGTAVYAVTLSATGMIKLWRTLPNATPTWVLQ